MKGDISRTADEQLTKGANEVPAVPPHGTQELFRQGRSKRRPELPGGYFRVSESCDEWNIPVYGVGGSGSGRAIPIDESQLTKTPRFYKMKGKLLWPE